MSFEISFVDALILMPKFASTLKTLIGNKEKLSEMARTPLNEHCSAVLLKKLHEKLGDPSKFLIPCDFPELAYRTISRSVGVAEDVYVKEKLSEMARTPLNEHCSAVLLYGKEVDAFLAVEDEPTSSEFYQPYLDPKGDILLLEAFLNDDPSPPLYQGNYMPEVRKELKFCEAHSKKSNSDFLLEEVEAFLAIEDDPTFPEFYQPYLDPEGDILILEASLNDDPSLPPPNQRNYLPE
nr:hypothetical protein [Tanacetum cinerariifolium]